MKIIPFIIGICFLLFTACNNDSGETESSTPANTGTTTSPSVTTPSITPATDLNGSADLALNPAHGLPGHRCDITVGAPLDSKPNLVGATTLSMRSRKNSKASSMILPTRSIRFSGIPSAFRFSSASGLMKMLAKGVAVYPT